jgi:putative restriction endonuclease
MKSRPWTRDELLTAINLYCKTPFGKMHRHNPRIISLAGSLKRSASAVAMKLVNFASIDPAQRSRNIRGLGNVSKLDVEVWREFYSNWEQLAFESEKAIIRLGVEDRYEGYANDISAIPDGSKTEAERTTRVRLVQGFFRNATLANYEFECAFCGIDIPDLLLASHIIPWKDDVARRADPRNGICLCALHDKAFDRGLMGLDSEFRILVSPVAKRNPESNIHRAAFLEIEGKRMALPKRFLPDVNAVGFHRSRIFRCVT